MSTSYDIPHLEGHEGPFTWSGWSDGADDCDPPEPGKFWLTIHDSDGDEVAIIVNRGQDPARMARKEAVAQGICDALNDSVGAARPAI